MSAFPDGLVDIIEHDDDQVHHRKESQRPLNDYTPYIPDLIQQYTEVRTTLSSELDLASSIDVDAHRSYQERPDPNSSLGTSAAAKGASREYVESATSLLNRFTIPPTKIPASGDPWTGGAPARVLPPLPPSYSAFAAPSSTSTSSPFSSRRTTLSSIHSTNSPTVAQLMSSIGGSNSSESPFGGQGSNSNSTPNDSSNSGLETSATSASYNSHGKSQQNQHQPFDLDRFITEQLNAGAHHHDHLKLDHSNDPNHPSSETVAPQDNPYSQYNVIISSPEGQVANRSGSGSASGRSQDRRSSTQLEQPASGSAPIAKSAKVGMKRRRGQLDPTAVDGQLYGDKSCNRCRERRVRCDRAYPICGRCLKRREGCSFPDQTAARTKDNLGQPSRVAALEAALMNVERQLEDKQQQQRQNHPEQSLVSTASTSSASALVPPSRLVEPDDSNQASSFPASLRRAVLPDLTEEESNNLLQFLFNEQLGSSNLGRSSVDYRLGVPGMSAALTMSLMDAAQRACCSRLPAIHTLTERLPYLKANLHALDPGSQLAVAVLCALGARASPHSALLSISTASLSDGTATPAMYLGAGVRRESACRALEARANEICWAGNIFGNPRWDNLEGVAALTQLLIFEEVKPKESRFFLRNAVGMFVDLIDFDSFDPGVEVRKSIGTSLFADDTMIAPRALYPCLISTAELQSHFGPAGVVLPNFVEERIGVELEALLSQTLTKELIEDALTMTALWVCGAQRLFSRLSAGRRAGAPSPLPEFRALYALIDETHSGIQKLQQFLVNVNRLPPGCENDPYALDHFVLLGVRADTYLVDIINLIHRFLESDELAEERSAPLPAGVDGATLLSNLRRESDLRVRKSLKLLAFYSQLFLQSNDKHLVYHLTIQLELLPSWPEIAAQRVSVEGSADPQEFELTEQELDWLRQGLELSCYFTPRAGDRLRQLTDARSRHRPTGQAPEDPLKHHAPPDPRPNESFGVASQQPNSMSEEGTAAQIEKSPQQQQEHHRQEHAQWQANDQNQDMEYSPYIFDTYGVVSSRDPSLPTHLVALDHSHSSPLVSAFRGQSWNNVMESAWQPEVSSGPTRQDTPNWLSQTQMETLDPSSGEATS